jgi:hypothetical protein
MWQGAGSCKDPFDGARIAVERVDGRSQNALDVDLEGPLYFVGDLAERFLAARVDIHDLVIEIGVTTESAPQVLDPVRRLGVVAIVEKAFPASVVGPLVDSLF